MASPHAAVTGAAPAEHAPSASPKSGETAESNPKVAERLLTFLKRNYEDIDRRFAILMTLQWAAAVIAAVTISPNTWAGAESTTHIHVYAAILLGGLISAPPAALAWLRPGSAVTRHLIAASQLLMSGLLIHLSGGRIETHFHVFVSLAFLSLYHDWRVLLTGVTVTGIDHAVRGIVWPESIYGVLTASPWRTLEHAGWAVFEVAFLAMACVQAVRMYRRRAAKEVEAEEKNERLDALLQDLETAQEETDARRRQADALAQQTEAERAYLEAEVERLLVAMEEFAEGDLSVAFERRADADASDEAEDLMERLASGFNRTVDTVRDMLQEVDAAVEDTRTAARRIGASTEQLSAGAEEQSAQADEVAAAVEEMSRTISANAGSVTRAAEVAHQNGKQAEEGAHIVDDAAQKMHEIAGVVQDSADTVRELGQSSEEIEEIVSIINEIADQTNLLALNAAIEAARAGEHGKGFAVVADEVRQLAERTTEATSSISSMVDEIQTQTREAVTAMHRGQERVQEGIDLADDTGDALGQIVGGTRETADTVSEIATATEQQSATSEQIAESVQNISAVSQDAARDVRQIADIVGEMEQQTVHLSQLVERFTFAGSANGAAHPDAPQAAGDGAAHPAAEPAAHTSPSAAEEPSGDGAFR